DDGEILKQFDLLDQHISAGGKERLPTAWARVAIRRSGYLEVFTVAVRADVEETLPVIDVVPVLLLARPEDGELIRGTIRGQEPELGRVFGIDLEQDVFPVAGLLQIEVVNLVSLLIQRLERRRAENVTQQLVRSFRHCVLGRQKESLVVGGPSHRSHA